jgi:hypothetical protein
MSEVQQETPSFSLHPFSNSYNVFVSYIDKQSLLSGQKLAGTQIEYFIDLKNFFIVLQVACHLTHQTLPNSSPTLYSSDGR